MSSSPSVSVVIPVYNGSAHLAEAMESVDRQTHPVRELVVVDDRSTDDSVEVARRCAERLDVRVEIHVLDENSGGPARPVNVGVERASGDLVAVLDQDDVFDEEKLANEAGALAAHPAATFAFSRCVRLADRTPVVPEERFTVFSGADSGERDGEAFVAVLLRQPAMVVGFPGFTFRREACLEVGGIDESLAIAADVDLLCRLATGGSVVYTRRVGYSRREHEGNASTRNVVSRLDFLRILAKAVGSESPSVRSTAREELDRRVVELSSILAESGRWRSARELLRQKPWGPSAARTLRGLSRAAAYTAFCRITGRTWRVTDEQVRQAVELVDEVARRTAE